MPMGVTYTLLCRFWQSGLSYRRRFPVVYLTIKVMLRPRFVSKQLEVCAFVVCDIKDYKWRKPKTNEK